MESSAGFKKFVSRTNELVSDFENNPLFIKLKQGRLSMSEYHTLLNRLFHQVYNSSSSFAVAAANVDIGRWPIKEYLFKHAEEEMTHWRWITNDLQKTGYNGTSPEVLPPCSEALAYISLNFYVAQTWPEGRLAIASVLEGIGARYGEQSARLLAQNLGLKKEQMSFLAGHGEADVGHTQEIYDLLLASNLSENEWGIMTVCAESAYRLYADLFKV